MKCLPCAAGTFGNQDAQACQECHFSCIECDGATNLDCTKCEPIVTFLKTATGECINCDSNKFGDFAGQQCANCHATCLTCSGAAATNCLSCNITNSYYNEAAHTCVACAARKYGDTGACASCHASCTVCNGPAEDNCLSCTLPLYFYPNNNTCLANCPEYFYKVDASVACEDCHYSCYTCSGPDSN